MRINLSVYSLLIYLSKALGFVGILLIANKFNEDDLASYAFFTLIIQYITYANLGVQHNLINELSKEKSNYKLLIGDSYIIIATISFFILMLGILFLTYLIF